MSSILNIQYLLGRFIRTRWRGSFCMVTTKFVKDFYLFVTSWPRSPCSSRLLLTAQVIWAIELYSIWGKMEFLFKLMKFAKLRGFWIFTLIELSACLSQGLCYWSGSFFTVTIKFVKDFYLFVTSWPRSPCSSRRTFHLISLSPTMRVISVSYESLAAHWMVSRSTAPAAPTASAPTKFLSTV